MQWWAQPRAEPNLLLKVGPLSWPCVCLLAGLSDCLLVCLLACLFVCVLALPAVSHCNKKFLALTLIRHYVYAA